MMYGEYNFMKRLDRLFVENDGDPEKVFQALGIEGDSDDNCEFLSDDDEDGGDLFDLDSALHTIGKLFK